MNPAPVLFGPASVAARYHLAEPDGPAPYKRTRLSSRQATGRTGGQRSEPKVLGLDALAFAVGQVALQLREDVILRDDVVVIVEILNHPF